MGALPSLGYHAMRLRWCRAAILAFLRRWAAYAVVGAALLTIGMAGGPGAAAAAVAAVCAWLVLPLFRAASEPAWLGLAIVLQALVGAGLVWGLRPLLWPVRWASAERALPIGRRDRLRSDAMLVPIALLPWLAPCALGAAALLLQDPTWLAPVRGRAAAALLAAMAGSVGLGVASLQVWRQRSEAGTVTPGCLATRAAGPRATSHVADAGWFGVLVWWPLQRGPARRSQRLLWAGSALLCLPAAGAGRWPGAIGWWLAAQGLGTLLVVTRLNGLLRLELDPLWQGCAALPLGRRVLERARDALALAPWLVSTAALLGGLQWASLRLPVLLGYLVVVFGSALFELRSTDADAADRSTRWLLSMVLMLALASEVGR